jgi:hypothetical protein
VTASSQAWDKWFEATGDEESLRAWAAVKQVHTDHEVLDRWATVIEMNRLDRKWGGREETPQGALP